MTTDPKFWADLVGVAHLATAGAATVHVLLRKRDVRAAIGWIGLCWLSPFSGPALYLLFGINRVYRRAGRLAARSGSRLPAPDAAVPPAAPDVAPHLHAIALVGSRMTATPPLPGNAAKVLDGGDAAFAAMLEAVATARRSIALCSYIFRADALGMAFIAALADAQRRGVAVRVLIDGVGGGYILSPAARALQRAGVPVARFMHEWLPWRMPFINLRNHKKIMVVDGRTGFVGGLNIGAETLRRRRHAAVDDVHARIAGPAVAHILRSFAEDWRYTTGERLEGADWWPTPEPAGTICGRGIASGPDEAAGHIETVLLAAIGAARRRIRIATPYFLPDQRLLAAIEMALLRGVDVGVVLPARSDHALVDWAVRGHLAAAKPPALSVHLTEGVFDHAKLVSVDGEWSAIGSPNWDVRSMRLNFEFLFEFYGADATAAIEARIDRRIARTRPLTSRDLAIGRPAARLRNAAARLLLPYL